MRVMMMYSQIRTVF